MIERQGPSPDGIKPGPVTRYQYDGDGNLVASFDANGNETQYVYNDRNERIEEIDPAPGGTISYSYNAAQQLVQVVDAVGHVTQYQYGPDGNRTATIAPNLATGLAGNANEDTHTFERARKSVQQRSDCRIIERERSGNRRRNRVNGNDAIEKYAAGAEIAWSAREMTALPVHRRAEGRAVNQKRAG